MRHLTRHKRKTYFLLSMHECFHTLKKKDWQCLISHKFIFIWSEIFPSWELDKKANTSHTSDKYKAAASWLNIVQRLETGNFLPMATKSAYMHLWNLEWRIFVQTWEWYRSSPVREKEKIKCQTTTSDLLCFNVCTLFLLLSDGQQIWEMEATVDRDKTQAVS